MAEHQYLTLFCGYCGHEIRVPKYCGNRFCDTCGTFRTRRLRKRMGAVTAKIVPPRDHTIKLLTLTVPRAQNLPETIDNLVKSFRRLRQRAWWKKQVRGGAYFIEFKHTPAGWNPHLHCIIESRFIPVRSIRDHWAQVSPGKIVDIRRIPIGSAVRYATKYCTKLDLPEVLQQQASDALRNKRLFNFFGYWSRIPSRPDPDLIVCKECGVGHWIFNPYSSIGAWVEKNTSEHVDILPRSRPDPVRSIPQAVLSL